MTPTRPRATPYNPSPPPPLQAEHARVTQERASLWGESEALADALNKSSQQLVVVSQASSVAYVTHF